MQLIATTGSMIAARTGHTATKCGSVVLIAGGKDASGNVLATAEIYNPATGQFVATGAMTTPRVGHTATPLSDGRVLITGGQDGSGNYLSSAEYFMPPSPGAGVFVAATSGLSAGRSDHSADVMADGRLLISGGTNGGAAALSTGELYNPYG